MTECPFCGKEFFGAKQRAVRLSHIQETHLPGSGLSKHCFCGSALLVPFRRHIQNAGGLERHLHDYLMGTERGQKT